ncbi:MAG: RloB family protein [Bacteroidota bacterium]
MILTNRKFVREAPSRLAKSIYIFCEGAKREYQYFMYFKEMDSRINVEVYQIKTGDDNSPLGLLNIAKDNLLATEANPNPKYRLIDGDEVWIVLDTDKDKDESRKPQIETIYKECEKLSNWFVAQSNPCFEVWLYNHLKSDRPKFNNHEYCKAWKDLVNASLNGGFDSRKHPIYIEEATKNAEANYAEVENNIPEIGCTQVFVLSKSILPLIKEKIDNVLKQL